MIENVYQQVIDENLLMYHLGVTHNSDDYDVARLKVDAMINYHIHVATDSAVNGGFFLMKKEDLQDIFMLMCACFQDGLNNKLSDLVVDKLEEISEKYNKELTQ